jgi:hypothetical protein
MIDVIGQGPLKQERSGIGTGTAANQPQFQSRAAAARKVGESSGWSGG